MIARMKQKLSSIAAETMVEVLAAILVAALGSCALAGMVMTSQEVVDRAETKAERIGTSENLMNTRGANEQTSADGVSYDQYSNLVVRIHYSPSCAPDLYVRYMMAKDSSKSAWTKVYYARYAAQNGGGEARQGYQNAWSNHKPQGV